MLLRGPVWTVLGRAGSDEEGGLGLSNGRRSLSHLSCSDLAYRSSSTLGILFTRESHAAGGVL